MDLPKTINKEIEEVFKRYSLNFSPNHPFDELTSLLDQSREKQLVFYHLREGEEHAKKFRERCQRGRAGTIIVGRETPGVEGKNIVTVGENFTPLARECVDLLYPVPKNKKYIGVTGTNGKSSVVSFISQLAHHSKIRVLTIGTLGVFLNNEKQDIATGGTTPSGIDLRRILHTSKDDFELCVVEASSHGLEQKRVRGMEFDIGVWTNLTRDHLDYHGTMEAYFLAKLKIKDYLGGGSVILIPSTSRELVERDGAPFSVVNMEENPPLPPFCRTGPNRINAMLAVESLKRIYQGRSFDALILESVEGRINIFQKGKKTVVVDYAHTPDALRSIIETVARQFSKKVILLFGAGGGRDPFKRKIMGEIADKHADFSYLTTDNPRYERPEKIIDEIEKGFSSKRYKTVVDRGEAIDEAVKRLGEDEVLVVAGKGNERHIEKEGKFHPFNDIDMVKKMLEAYSV